MKINRSRKKLLNQLSYERILTALPHHPSMQRKASSESDRNIIRYRLNERPKLRKRSRALTVLSAIANGSLAVSTVLIAASAPFPRGREIRRWQYKILHHEPSIDLEILLRSAQQRNSTARAIKDIRMRRWAQLKKRKGQMVLEITEEGRKRFLQHRVETLPLPQPEHWNGQWRIVLFDIPEKERLGRDVLRGYLKSLGFFRLQHSAFVFPGPCEDQLITIVFSHT